jgi:hypothetical protein
VGGAGSPDAARRVTIAPVRFPDFWPSKSAGSPCRSGPRP